MIEVRAVRSNDRRPGVSGRLISKHLGTRDGMTEALAAFRLTRAEPGSRIEMRLVCTLDCRYQPHPGPRLDPLQGVTARAAGVQFQNDRIIPPIEPLDSEAIRQTIEDTRWMRGELDRATGLNSASPEAEALRRHLCDSDGRLVDTGQGIYVHTCSQCGKPQ